MTQTIETLRPVLEKLVSYRDAEDKGLTQQAMAEKLNAEGVPSLTGATWSKYSIRRILKKLNFQTVISASQQDLTDSQPSTDSILQNEQPDTLKADSPLRQWSYFESIRDAVEELTSKPYTPKKLAVALNQRGIATVDGSRWNVDSVTRVLKVLTPGTSRSQLADDEIRENIRRGMYDTPDERFISVPHSQQPEKAKAKGGKSKDKVKKRKDKKKKKK